MYVVQEMNDKGEWVPVAIHPTYREALHEAQHRQAEMQTRGLAAKTCRIQKTRR